MHYMRLDKQLEERSHSVCRGYECTPKEKKTKKEVYNVEKNITSSSLFFLL